LKSHRYIYATNLSEILTLKEKPMAHLLFSLPGGAEWIVILFFITLPVALLYLVIKYGIKNGMKSAIKDALREMKRDGEI